MSKPTKTKEPGALNPYEADLEKNINKAKPLSKKEKMAHLAKLKQALDTYMTKNKRISIRVYGSDLDRIKRIAMQEGLPYQTLITSILHKYATGQMRDRTK